jgi:hypothetical protein
MEIMIDSDEWYPVYSVVEDFGVKCEVPEETLERWRRIAREFAEMQCEMNAAHAKASGWES